MSKIDTLRAQLVADVRAARKAREEAEQSKHDCDHEWQRFRETITPDNDAFRGTAYFRLIACDKCKRKQYLELRLTLA